MDYRHLYLIGDYLTFGGNIKAMNRNWMNYNPSLVKFLLLLTIL